MRSPYWHPILTLLAGLGPLTASWAWDYEGHRLVNQLALQTLPAEFPSFVRTAEARERIAFLGGEADRWRNVPDYSFRHINNPDHFLDLEDLAPLGLTADGLPPFRYEYVARIALVRAADPSKFRPIDPNRDLDRTRALPGFLPWTITEHYGKLKSAFAYLKVFEREGGAPEEIGNARQNIVYLMGVMGHFVADAAQPLHTTRHYNGWVGANPNGYTTNRAFHGWIDGGALEKMELRLAELAPQMRPAVSLTESSASASTNLFPVVARYLVAQFALVEPLYRLEKQGDLAIESQPTGKGRELISQQLIKAAQMLGAIWTTAWKEAPPDPFLSEQMARRKGAVKSPGG